MLTLCCNITINSAALGKDIRFTSINSCEIIASLKSLTGTAKLTLPRKINADKRFVDLKRERIIARGDKIRIELGYNDELHTAFDGYVVRISSGFPVQLECEDSFFLFKKQIVKSWQFKKDSTLKQVMSELGFDSCESSDVLLPGLIAFKDMNIVKVFQTIQNKYSLLDVAFFFRGSTLYALHGESLTALKGSSTHVFRIEGERSNTISNTLIYEDPQDMDIRVEVSSLQPLNSDAKKSATKIKTSGYGSTLLRYSIDGITEDSKLQEYADNKLELLESKQVRGKLLVFGKPVVQIGDKVKLIDETEGQSELEGTFLVESVTTQFGFSTGYRQEIGVGSKVKEDKK